jgi:putative ABC transport system permease protein
LELPGPEGPLDIRLDVRSSHPGPLPIITTTLAGMIRTGLERPLWFDEQVPALRLEPVGYRGFRLYASGIEDVAGLAAALAAEGVPTRSRAREIERVQLIDRSLTTLFYIIAGLAIAAAIASITVSTLAAVRRKTADLGTLRLIGIRRAMLFFFPIWQNIVVAIAASLLSLLAFFAVSEGINARLAGSLGFGDDLCILFAHHYLAAVAVIIVTCMAGGLAGAAYTMAIDPREALRAD